MIAVGVYVGVVWLTNVIYDSRTMIGRQRLPYENVYQFRGVTMSYRKFGEGRPIVLLHGSVINWPQIGEFETGLAELHTVYLPDMPGNVSGWKFELTRRIPLGIQQWLITTRWGQEKLLPILMENIGDEEGNVEELFELVSHTDPRSIVEVDYKKEIERDLPLSLKKVKNEVVFIYGENDKLRGTIGSLIGNYITVPGGTHNTFRTNPQGTLEAVKNSLD